jgi:ABC-type transport system involved in multi-copper enzyme maturation permease subunit
MSPQITSPETSFLASARAMCRLALPMTLWSRRTLLMAMLGLFLPLAASLFLAVKAIPSAEIRVPGYIFYSNAFQFVHYYVMLVALFYGTAVVAEEIDGKTLTYLLTRPLDRAAILLGKGAAAWSIGALILVPVLTATYVLFTLADGVLFAGDPSGFWINMPTLLADLALVLTALAVYTALFTLVGALFNRPVLWGIAIAFGWESWVAFVPGLTRKLTVMHYIQSLSPHASGRNVAIALLGQQSGTGQSMLALAVFFILFAGLAAWTFRRREYNFDLSQR